MDEPRAAQTLTAAEDLEQFRADKQPASVPAVSVSEPTSFRHYTRAEIASIFTGVGKTTCEHLRADEKTGKCTDCGLQLYGAEDLAEFAAAQAAFDAGVDMPGVGRVECPVQFPATKLRQESGVELKAPECCPFHKSGGSLDWSCGGDTACIGNGGGLSYEVAAIENLRAANPGVVGAVGEEAFVARARESVLRGRPHRAGEFPETLREIIDHDDREALLIQLIYAAGRLADHSISRRLPWGPDACPDCGALARHTAEEMLHRPGCRVGDVVKVIQELQFQQLKSQEAKEEAPKEETAAVGDGIRTPGMKHRVCMFCGESGGVWEGEYRDGSVNLSLLGLNQRVGPGIDGIGHTLYTHRCSGSTETRELPNGQWSAPKGGAR